MNILLSASNTIMYSSDICRAPLHKQGTLDNLAKSPMANGLTGEYNKHCGVIPFFLWLKFLRALGLVTLNESTVLPDQDPGSGG